MKSGLFILTLSLLPLCFCRIVEKIETACNGPCGRLVASCPKGQRVAIRDAVYRVQDKTPACSPFPGCTDRKQDVCCEPSPQDCVFPYSPTHLKAVLRNCSGNQDCVIQTERSEVETVACSSSDPANTSSQTALNYVCVDEEKIADICSFHEMSVEGKTLFAMVNPKGSQKLSKGSVCSCIAESTRWPTTNSIAVFLVDLRINKKKSRNCSNVTLSMRSGNNVKKLDCESSQDPRVNFPFVAILNDSNVATMRLEMTSHMPEFVWIGFEANEEEDIRLTCKLQGVLHDPTSTDAPGTSGNNDDVDNNKGSIDDDAGVDVNTEELDNNKDKDARSEMTDIKADSNRRKPTKKPQRSKVRTGAIVGGVLAAIALMLVLIVLAIIFLVRRRRRFVSSQGVIDMDVYYSIDSTLDISSTFKSGQDGNVSKVNPPIGKRKKSNSNKRVRIISTPDFVEESLPEYTTAVEVRERKRLSQQPRLSHQKSNNYDHLRNDNQRQSDLILDSYDQLDCSDEGPPPYSSIHDLHDSDQSPTSNKKKSMTSSLRPPSLGNVNEAYEETEISPGQGQQNDMAAAEHPVEIADALYFELEKQTSVSSSNSNQDNEVTSSECKNSDSKKSDNTSSQLTLSIPTSSSSSPPASPTYNDAMSLSENVSVPSTSSIPSDGDKQLQRQSFPTAAPRKKTLAMKDSRASQYDYDIAQPIQE